MKDDKMTDDKYRHAALCNRLANLSSEICHFVIAS
jgi:hypothetical protein